MLVKQATSELHSALFILSLGLTKRKLLSFSLKGNMLLKSEKHRLEDARSNMTQGAWCLETSGNRFLEPGSGF